MSRESGPTYIPYVNYASSVDVRIIAPFPIKVFGYLTQLQQDWPLFAPAPMDNDGWFVVEGVCQNGQTPPNRGTF